MEVNINDNSGQVLNELERKIKVATKAIGYQMEKNAKKECPVDTGRLRNSINNKATDDAIYVGTNVEYAPAVEFGDNKKHKTGKAHFLRDSIADHINEYKNLAKQILK